MRPKWRSATKPTRASRTPPDEGQSTHPLAALKCTGAIYAREREARENLRDAIERSQPSLPAVTGVKGLFMGAPLRMKEPSFSEQVACAYSNPCASCELTQHRHPKHQSREAGSFVDPTRPHRWGSDYIGSRRAAAGGACSGQLESHAPSRARVTDGSSPKIDLYSPAHSSAQIARSRSAWLLRTRLSLLDRPC